jgi:type IV secretion system protein VirB2
MMMRYRQKLRDYAVLACVLFPSLSHATDIESIINGTVNYLQGGLARSVGILSIIIAGYLCLARQRFPKEYLGMILIGLGLIFGGSYLYSKVVT